MGSIYAALDRLEEKSFVVSKLGESTPERGGRAKHYFHVTPSGLKALRTTRTALTKLWSSIPLLEGRLLASGNMATAAQWTADLFQAPFSSRRLWAAVATKGPTISEAKEIVRVPVYRKIENTMTYYGAFFARDNATGARLLSLCLLVTVPATASELHGAALTCDLPRLQELLAKSPNAVNEPDADGNTPLHFAARATMPACAAALVRAGANGRILNHAGMSPLQVADSLPDRQLRDRMKFAFLSHVQDQQGKLPPWTLEYAVLRGQTDVVRMLLQLGSDPNLLGSDGNTPLDDACLKGHVAIAKLLLEKGAKVIIRSKSGTLPLHDAATAGHASLVELLLHNGAAIDETADSSGETALHLAAAWGRVEALQVLLKAGASVRARDKKGRTPLQSAVENEQTDTAAILRQSR